MRSGENPARCNQRAPTFVSPVQCHPSLPWPTVLDSSLTVNNTSRGAIMPYATVTTCKWSVRRKGSIKSSLCVRMSTKFKCPHQSLNQTETRATVRTLSAIWCAEINRVFTTEAVQRLLHTCNINLRVFQVNF